MKTLAELDPQVGDTVTYTAARETGTYTVLARTAEEWTFRSGDDVDFSECTDGVYGSQSKWSLKPKEPVPTECCQQPRYTLPQLNPKVGDTLVYWGSVDPPIEYTVTACEKGVWTVQETQWGTEYEASSAFANQARWTLKSKAPEESKVTVADLNLSVGDRVQQGRWTGTVTDTNSQHVEVLWDWSTVRSRFTQSATPSLTLLPKPEPTLADLGLKVGDGVWDTHKKQFGVVAETTSRSICVNYGLGITNLDNTYHASRLKKLEVPK